MRIQPAILVAILVLLIAAGGGAYYVMSTPTAPKIVTFIGQSKPVEADTDALAAPHAGAPLVASLSKGVAVTVNGLIEGGQWAEISLPDRRTAYIPTISVSLAPGTTDLAQAAPSAANSAPAPSAPAKPAAPSGSASDRTAPPAINFPPVEFGPVSEVYTTTKQVTVYVEPNTQAPQRYQLDPGTSVPVVARSKNGMWARASTEDGQPAFLLVADLGQPQTGKSVVVPDETAAAAPQSSPPAGSSPDTVDGTAKVVTTSSIEVGGQKIAIANIVGEDNAAYVEQLQTIIDSQGGSLHCVRQDQAYQCKLPTGIDIALSALFNGGARPTDSAPPAYLAQAKSAQAAKRGLWH